MARPWSSTGVGTGSRPARASVATSRGQHGSSIATRFTPRAASSRHTNGSAGPEPAGDHDLVGARLHAAPAGERRGQHLAQLRLPARVGIPEPRVRRGAQDPVERAPPRGPERPVERGQRGPQVEPGRPRAHVLRRPGRVAAPAFTRRGFGDRRLRRALADQPGVRVRFAARHERPAAPARQQVALGGQLRVGLHDHAARDPELGGQPPRGREARADRQAPDRDAERVLAAGAQRAIAAEVEVEVHLARDYEAAIGTGTRTKTCVASGVVTAPSTRTRIRRVPSRADYSPRDDRRDPGRGADRAPRVRDRRPAIRDPDAARARRRHRLRARLRRQPCDPLAHRRACRPA